MNPLDLVEDWPVPNVAAAIIDGGGRATRHGDGTHLFRLASISKIITTWAVLVAVEEGSFALDTPVGQPGCTLRHLLSHAGGYGFDGPDPVSAPERRRIYSNTGIELAADALEQATGIEFETYLREAVLEPLGMANTELRGSPARGIWSGVDDLIDFVIEIFHPSLISTDMVATATSVQFGYLDGVVPGIGRFRPCPWGLGVEIRGGKRPHWTGTLNGAATFGHFGGSGTMLWVDPDAGVGLIALTDRDFDDWSSEALDLWPQLSDAVLATRSG